MCFIFDREEPVRGRRFRRCGRSRSLGLLTGAPLIIAEISSLMVLPPSERPVRRQVPPLAIGRMNMQVGRVELSGIAEPRHVGNSDSAAFPHDQASVRSCSMVRLTWTDVSPSASASCSLSDGQLEAALVSVFAIETCAQFA